MAELSPINPDSFRQNDLMNPGHLGCPGCGATIAMKFALQALGAKTMVVIPASVEIHALMQCI